MGIGVVVIGRNEGERLKRCLNSVNCTKNSLIYVDSGSTDDSIEVAKSRGFRVIELDPSTPFTAARARNKGFDRLVGQSPEVEFVQFVDGDCAISENWLVNAEHTLATNQHISVACGRLREREREKSIFGRLSDMELNTEPGEIKYCGGIFMVRVSCFVKTGGFNPALIAGEEPELCLRLRRCGWSIVRLGDDMATHDGGDIKLLQWWKRSVRGGYAYAQVSWLTRNDNECLWIKQSRSVWFWGLILPATILASTVLISAAGAFLIVGYALLGYRVYRYRRSRGDNTRDARLYSFFCILGKVPQAIGQLGFHKNRLLNRGNRLIEYK